MKSKLVIALLGSLPLGAILPFYASAQVTSLPKQEKTHILINPNHQEETLSGIHLLAGKKGAFYLDISQELKEDAVLEVKNEAGLVVFKKPVSITGKKKRWGYHVGRLKPDTYLIEVKTSDTTYWTKFKIDN